MDWSQYTDRHIHPANPGVVEIVAYERQDGAWDVYVFEPAGSCPEIEADRTDQDHIFVARVGSPDDIDPVARAVDERLGDSYRCAVYYRETGGRKIIGRIQRHLQEHGGQHIVVRAAGAGDWELIIRRRDFDTAREGTNPNV
jgi:hypothetical protein